jgi:hypothetical protein
MATIVSLLLPLKSRRIRLAFPGGASATTLLPSSVFLLRRLCLHSRRHPRIKSEQIWADPTLRNTVGSLGVGLHN